MVFGLLGIAAVPTATGIVSGLSAHDQSQSAHSEEQRREKFNLKCYCTQNTASAGRINNGLVALRDGKLYILPCNEKIKGHLFEGFYITYPDVDMPQPSPMGLVSSISDEPALLNWIYVDRKTRELRYGNRTRSREHIVGSWDWIWTDDDDPGRLVLENEEAAVAVRTPEDFWEVKWADEDGTACAGGKERVDVSLERKMLRKKETDGPVQGKMPGSQDDVLSDALQSPSIESDDCINPGAAKLVAGNSGTMKRTKPRKAKRTSFYNADNNEEAYRHELKPPH